MRIAFIAPFGMQPKGTVAARMLPLAHALANRGHLVRVIIPPWDDPSAKPGSITSLLPAEDDKTGGVQVVTLPLPNRVPYSLRLTYGLVRQALRPTYSEIANNALTTFRAEVCHVFKPVGYSGLAGFALQAAGVPWVLDIDDWEGPGGWADINPYSPAQKLIVALQDALLPRLAGATTTASRTLEARTWGFGLPRGRVFYMPNGVWRDKYGAWPHRKADQARLSNLKEMYGLEGKPIVLLYTRFAEFPYRWPLDVLQWVIRQHPDATLLVVGNGFFGEEEKLEAEATRRGMADNVVRTGRVAEQEVPAYLALGDVALYPMEDNLINRAKSPVKVLEPMVMGLPIVAHRVGQAAEFIGDTGVLVEPGNLRGMADAITGLLNDPGRRAHLGNQAQTRVWAQFNWEQLCEAAEEAYQAVLRSNYR